MALWTFSDWITLDDRQARLTRLRLHIAEVSQRVVGTSNRGSAVTAANQKYLEDLMARETLLTRAVSRPGIARNRVRVRD